MKKMSYWTLGLVAVIFAALVAWMSQASAHTPQATISCTGYSYSAANYESSQDNTYSFSVDGVSSGVQHFGSSFGPITGSFTPNDGKTHTLVGYVYQNNDPNAQYSKSFDLSAGPCGSPSSSAPPPSSSVPPPPPSTSSAPPSSTSPPSSSAPPVTSSAPPSSSPAPSTSAPKTSSHSTSSMSIGPPISMHRTLPPTKPASHVTKLSNTGSHTGELIALAAVLLISGVGMLILGSRGWSMPKRRGH